MLWTLWMLVVAVVIVVIVVIGVVVVIIVTLFGMFPGVIVWFFFFQNAQVDDEFLTPHWIRRGHYT